MGASLRRTLVTLCAFAFSLSVTHAGKPVANQPPSVSLVAPLNGASFPAGSNVTLSANATDSDGTIARVDFYSGGTTLIGTATVAPYTITWSSAAAGSYSLTAKATDNGGAATTSTAVSITVTAGIPPTVTLTSPSSGSVFAAGSDIPLTATAADTDGTVARVDFYNGATLLGTAAGAPYSFTWAAVPSGSYTLTARATDNQDVVTTSASAAITVAQAPLVVVTAPAACTVLDGPASLIVAADAVPIGTGMSKVEFFQGQTPIGATTSSPYAFAWSDVPVGTYSVTAKATDKRGLSSVSEAVSVTIKYPGTPPSVSLTAPANGAVLKLNTPASLTASASDSDGTVAKVEFHAGATLIGTVTQAPYTASWTPVVAGLYSLTAKATDNLGAATTSAPVSVTATSLTVALTAPVAGTTYLAPATINLSATASDNEATIVKVEFYADAALIGTATVAPYAATWGNVPAGTYALTAKATDSAGVSVTSSPVSVTVSAHPPPAVSLATNAGSYFAPATVALTATASATDATIAKVDFYNGATLIGTATTAPYTYSWTNVSAGSYTLTAKVTDSLGAVTTSTAVTVAVNATPVSNLSPVSGVTVTTGSLLVSGSVQAPPNSGITVNGVLAVLDGNGNFYANNVPLQAGANTLTIVLTAQDGSQYTQTATVNYTPQANAATITASAFQGVAPLTVTFNVTAPNNATVQKIELDYDDDGTIDQTFSNISAFTVTFPAPAAYPIRIRVTDSAGNVTVQHFVLIVNNATDTDTVLRAVYTGMLDQLRAGNINGALNSISPSIRDKYNSVFNALGPNLSSAVDNIGTLQSGQFASDWAEYVLVRDTANGPQAFLVYFIRGGDGIWRIGGM